MNINGRNIQPLNLNPYNGTSISHTKGNDTKRYSSTFTEIINAETLSSLKKKKKKQLDYYTMFTKAIQQNEDELLNQKKCVEEIQKIKSEEEGKKSRKIRFKPTRLKEIKFQTIKGEVEQTQIDDIENQKAKNEKIFGSLIPNLNDHHDCDGLFSSIKNPKNEKEDTKENDEDMKLCLKQKMRKKRRRILQSALVYFESNSICLSDFLQKNPFQDKPYALSYSFEYIEAVKFGQYEMVKEALEMNHEFLFSFDYFRQTGYHWAAKLGNYKILNLLLSTGKYCNQYDNHNRTPLYLASLNNHTECCRLLVSNYANPFMADINGKKPVDVATDNDIYVLISNYMDTPYSNPVIRQKMNLVFKLIEEKKIKKALEEKMMKEAKDRAKLDSLLHEESENI